ncbi:unnamed protein product, partial [Rotaria socialis]
NIESHFDIFLTRNWADGHGLRFSAEKTVAMVFTRRRGLFYPNITLYGSPIRIVDEFKFLGLIFDSRLTWIPHFKQLRKKCLKALDILKVVSHTSWGADRRTLHRLYTSLVLSKLNYGSQIYSSATPSRLKMLDPIHNLGIRLVTGAFRSSPVVSLYAESGEHPLELHREELCLSYLFRLNILPDSDISMTIKQAIANPLLLPNCKYQSYIVRMTNLLPNLDEHPSMVMPYSYQVIPPWMLPRAVICRKINQLGSKSETPANITRNMFLSHMSDHVGAVPIYTDGSKSENGVAFAAV